MMADTPSDQDVTSIDRLIAWATELLEDSSSSCLDSQLLAMKAFGCSREQILAKSLPTPAPAQSDEFVRLVRDRKRNIPIAYLLGTKEFWGLDFQVTPAVLIPRPESELIVSLALKTLERMQGRISVLELGVGSACLSVALATELKSLGKEFSITGVEKSPAALQVAQRNVNAHKCDGAIILKEGDWFLGMNPRTDSFDLMITNPPYVATFEKCSPEIYHEPPEALFANSGGMADIQRIFAEAPRFLSESGSIICEVGGGKRSLMHDLLGKAGNRWNYELAGDLNNPNGFTVVVARPVGK